MKRERRRVTVRTAERLQRAAYEFEHLATVLRAEGHEAYANSLKDISSRLGNIGRDLFQTITNP